MGIPRPRTRDRAAAVHGGLSPKPARPVAGRHSTGGHARESEVSAANGPLETRLAWVAGIPPA
jgi:hypothetical protein